MRASIAWCSSLADGVLANRMCTGRERKDDVASDRGGVPDLDRHQEAVDRLVERRHRLPLGRALEVVQLDDPAGRGDLEPVRRRSERRPAETLQVDQRFGWPPL